MQLLPPPTYSLTWRQNKKDEVEKILRENAELKSENRSLNENLLQLNARLDQQREETSNKYDGLTYLMHSLHTKVDALTKVILTRYA